ncbi:MAG: D-alanine--D-alanine ligase [Pseudomonadota bacterium]|nr:D-alanine--D-alanine ligase [Pseudomonadota bacterium]
MTRHVAVLMGGWSTERDVSILSGLACAQALQSSGFQVTKIDVDRNISSVLGELKPDVCFNALHGPIGEDGNIQGLLNIMGIPYTHSGVQASAIAMDKIRTKELCSKAGLLCPEGVSLARSDISLLELETRPFVIKPKSQGSSIGVNIVYPKDNYISFLEKWSYGEEIVVERFIPGRELTVGVLNGNALCVTEITSERGFYDFSAKYESGGSKHIIPADVPDIITRKALDQAVLAHKTLGCRGVSRSDFRYDDTQGKLGELYFLEVNTQPGMTSTSLIPEQASHAGMTFSELLIQLLEAAKCDL